MKLLVTWRALGYWKAWLRSKTRLPRSTDNLFVFTFQGLIRSGRIKPVRTETPGTILRSGSNQEWKWTGLLDLKFRIGNGIKFWVLWLVWPFYFFFFFMQKGVCHINGWSGTTRTIRELGTPPQGLKMFYKSCDYFVQLFPPSNQPNLLLLSSSS